MLRFLLVAIGSDPICFVAHPSGAAASASDGSSVSGSDDEAEDDPPSSPTSRAAAAALPKYVLPLSYAYINAYVRICVGSWCIGSTHCTECSPALEAFRKEYHQKQCCQSGGECRAMAMRVSEPWSRSKSSWGKKNADQKRYHAYRYIAQNHSSFNLQYHAVIDKPEQMSMPCCIRKLIQELYP